MEFEGLISSYPANRPLTREEIEDYLPVDRRNDVEPQSQLAAIRANSTFLELTDKFFGAKGQASLVALLVIGISILAMAAALISVVDGIEQASQQEMLDGMAFLAMTTLIFMPLFGAGLWFLLSESFSLTHFPIRFNRRNRMVYVFRTNGSVLCAPWDELFFTLCRQPRGGGLSLWEVRAHVLASDGTTVRETFALPFAARRHEPALLSLWEFVRRYMEDGPQDTVPRIARLTPISQQRERFWHGCRRLWSELVGGAPMPVMFGLLAPLFTPLAITRQFAKWTSRIPVWPAEVEAACEIAADDPYVKE
ncbi:DUF6708 domain-containing protein [Pseudothauera lacus]|nr:DUF6708 domain-containing protein [Pseudothauera lacus]